MKRIVKERRADDAQGAADLVQSRLALARMETPETTSVTLGRREIGRAPVEKVVELLPPGTTATVIRQGEQPVLDQYPTFSKQPIKAVTFYLP